MKRKEQLATIRKQSQEKINQEIKRLKNEALLDKNKRRELARYLTIKQELALISHE